MKLKTPLAVFTGLTLFGLSIVYTTNQAFAKNTTHALIIGIGSYTSPKISPLSTPVNDARSMKLFVEDNFLGEKKISLLIDEEATRKAILDQLKEMIKTVNKGDQFVFYYSGHGSQIPDENNEEADGLDETIVSVDADFYGGKWHNMIIDDELDSLLKQIEDKGVDVLVISDACHSGSITKSLDKTNKKSYMLSDDLVKRAYEARRKEEAWLDFSPYRTTWTAVASGQSAIENINLNNSIYTTLLIEGVSEKRADFDRDGIVTNSELHSYLLKSSETYCKLSKCKDGLTPTLAIQPEYLFQPFIPDPAYNRHHQDESASSAFTLPPEVALEEALSQKISSDISISIQPKGSVKIGDEIFVGVKSKKSGYLVLLDVNARGELIQIFPNKEAKDNHIKGGKTKYIPENDLAPYAITANEIGKSHMYAIVMHDAIDMQNILNKNKDLKPIPKNNAYIGEMIQLLNKPWTGDAITRIGDYSVARIDYIVHHK